jgi:hypothetical protein
MLLHHLDTMHPADVGPYLAHMRMEDTATVAVDQGVSPSQLVQEFLWKTLNDRSP